ncbi:MAG: hydroxyacylglutathione hydrolase [Frankiales bacterium]|jgi:glyoxylase-like metal-dependent hydrolase (beta-lactamase superfamily II)/rhodanese-related sulfurtransferase|nr:hydroxyacylglutathione hydrolase [Frankiales bacterium]
MQIVTLETPWLGNRSYVVIDDVGERSVRTAIVVDPPRDIDRIHAVLEAHGAKPQLVLETHRHADYISGGLQLARETAAVYAVPPGTPDPAFEYVPVTDGTTFAVGQLTIRAIHTPGHTAHHMSYVLEDRNGPKAVFTGGSLLHGSVGRTDLVDSALTQSLSELQWRSVHRLAAGLPLETAVMPTHGFGSFCSAAPASTRGSSTVGGEIRCNSALTSSLEEFVEQLMRGYDAYPSYYAHVPHTNAAGPAPIDLSPPRRLSSDEVLARIDAGEWVVDLRQRRVFAAGHVPGTLSFDAGGNVSVYLTWMLPWGAPVTLLGDDEDQVARIHRQLAVVGVENIAGAAYGRPADWVGPQIETRAFPVTDFSALASERETHDVAVLDVRNRGEWADGHVDGALNVPLPELLDRIGELPTRGAAEIWVYCGSGFRASAAASILEQAGHGIVLIDDQFASAAKAGLVVVPAQDSHSGPWVPGSRGIRTPTSRAVSKAVS